MRVKLAEVTPDAEKKIIRIARVSSPQNQDSPEYIRLLRYCVKHGHWSVFEHAHMTVEIETSLAIATQILRHRSFTFQQFSQRYADVSTLGFETVYLRKQAETNRQSSTDPLDDEKAQKLQNNIDAFLIQSRRLYLELLDAGVAKECARMVLPQCTTTRMYMTGNIRSWIHYLQLRTGEDVQLEHRAVAAEIQKIFTEQFPAISSALGWVEGEKKHDA